MWVLLAELVFSSYVLPAFCDPVTGLALHVMRAFLGSLTPGCGVEPLTNIFFFSHCMRLVLYCEIEKDFVQFDRVKS